METEEIKKLIVTGYRLEQINQNTINNLIVIIENAISTIATINPQLALDMIENLAEQYTQEGVNDILEKREEQEERMINALDLGEE